MPSLPQLIEEDVQELNRALQDLLVKAEASVALVIDKGGFLISQCGEHISFDTTTLAALSAGSFAHAKHRRDCQRDELHQRLSAG